MDLKKLTIIELEKLLNETPVDLVRVRAAREELERRQKGEPYTRAEKWTAASVIVAILALGAIFVVPELRRFIGLDPPAANTASTTPPQNTLGTVSRPDKPNLPPSKTTRSRLPEKREEKTSEPVQSLEAPQEAVAALKQQSTLQAPSSPPQVKVFRSVEDFIAEAEKRRAECEAKLPPEPPCHGDDLKSCGEKGLMEWGKPLLSKIKKIDEEYSLERKMAGQYTGNKFLRAVEAAEIDAADKYRDCCAADALKYFKELAQRMGGGEDSQGFYEWSNKLLSPVKSKEWKEARSLADIPMMHAYFVMQGRIIDLDRRIRSRCIGK